MPTTVGDTGPMLHLLHALPLLAIACGVHRHTLSAKFFARCCDPQAYSSPCMGGRSHPSQENQSVKMPLCLTIEPLMNAVHGHADGNHIMPLIRAAMNLIDEEYPRLIVQEVERRL